MKKLLTLGIVMLTTSILTIILYDSVTEAPAYPAGVVQTRLHSKILGEDRELTIHLPPNYDSTARYPVMYVLDGSSDDQHIANKLEILSAVGYTPKTIVVGIPNMNANNRQRNLCPPFMHIDQDDSTSPLGEGDRFLSFMESELIPFIENHYPASKVRLFSGNSRGGLLVMYSLLYKPELFQARFCYSTPFWRQNDILISKIANLLSSKDTLETFLYMSAGINETKNIKGGLARMTKTVLESAPFGLIHYSDYTPQADHQNNGRISATTGIGKWSEYIRNKK